MAEYDNNNTNPLDDTNSTDSQNQGSKTPEYSFWAEQMPNGSASNYNQGTNTSGYDNMPNGNIDGNNNPNRNPNMNPNMDPNMNPNRNPYMNYNGNPKNNPNMNYIMNNSNSGAFGDEPNKKPKKERKFLRFIGRAVSFGLIAGVCFLGIQALVYVANPDTGSKGIFANFINQSGTEDTSNYNIAYTDTASVVEESKSVISDVVDKTIPAIVSINSVSNASTEWFGQSFDQEVEGSGSGIIVGENDEELLIATNNHVVEGTTKITVTFIDGTEAEAVIKGTDSAADLAVVSVDISTLEQNTLDAISIATLGDSDSVEVGEMAIAIGNALGYGQSVTVGYISAKDREIEVSDGYETKTMVLLQTDAAINPGNSGGALLNVKGEVIGINSVKYSSNEVEGMGYAIPISKATPIITELMSREILSEEEQGYLGISGNDVTEEIATAYNMPIGVFVNEVSEGGGAAKAGLASGDIITAVNDTEVTAITQLREYVTSMRAGTEVEITYMRSTKTGYEEATITVTLGSNPSLTTEKEETKEE